MANGYHQVVTIKLSETDVVSLRIALENALRAWKAGGFNVEGAAPTSAIGDTASLLEELRHVMHGSNSGKRASRHEPQPSAKRTSAIGTSMNAHQRRAAERAQVRAMMPVAEIMLRNSHLTKQLSEAMHVPRCKGNNCDAVQGDDHSQECVADHAAACAPKTFLWIAGASVRNKRTGSIATIIGRANLPEPSDGSADEVWVHRRDNRKVFWPLSECENWNL